MLGIIGVHFSKYGIDASSVSDEFVIKLATRAV
jgi:hypothetical protein